MNTIDRPTAASIAEAIAQANIKPSTGQRRIDEYDLLERIAEGEGWEDWRAEHRTNKLPRRIRRWLSEDTFTADKPREICAQQNNFAPMDTRKKECIAKSADCRLTISFDIRLDVAAEI